MFDATQFSRILNFPFQVFGTVQNKVSAEIPFSISSLRIRVIAQECSLYFLKFSLGIRIGMREKPVSLGNAVISLP